LNRDRNYSRYEIQDVNELEFSTLLNSATLFQKTTKENIVTAILALSKQIQFYNYNGETDGDLKRFFASSLPLILLHTTGESISQNIRDAKDLGIQIERLRLKGNDINRKLRSDLTQLIRVQLENLELLKNSAFSEQKFIEELLPSFQSLSKLYLDFFNNCISDGLIPLNRKVKQQFYNLLPAPVFNSQISSEHWSVQLLQYTNILDEIDLLWKSIQSESKILLQNIIKDQSIDPISSLAFVLGDLLEEIGKTNTDTIDKSIADYFFKTVAKIAPFETVSDTLYAQFEAIPNDEIKTIPEGLKFKALISPEIDDFNVELTCAENTPINNQEIINRKIVNFSWDQINTEITDQVIQIRSTPPTRYQLEKLKAQFTNLKSPFYFTVSSPLLSVDGNTVKWKISLEFSTLNLLTILENSFDKNPDLKRSYDNLSIEDIFTSWIDNGFLLSYQSTESIVELSTDRIFFTAQKTLEQNYEFCWSLMLDSDDPLPVANPDGNVQLTFNFINDYLFLYPLFSNLKPNTLSIETSVLDVTNLELFNDFGKLDTTTPFNPFGTRPEIGSKFYVGHPLLFSNALTNLKINWQWYGLPDTNGGFKEHYNNYDLIESNEDFLVSISSLQGGTWYPETDKQVLPLFTTTTITENTEDKAISNIRRMNEINLQHLNLDKTHRNFEQLKEPNKSKFGYLAFELFSPAGAFGHSRFNDLVQRNMNNKKPATVQEPYTPLVTGISVEAVMHEIVAEDLINTRISCFGVEELIMNQEIISSYSLMPRTNYQSAMYLEFSNFDDGKASLYFQLPERFNGIQSKSKKQWYQWENKKWNEVETANIVRDETLAFECSGQILINELIENEPYINNWLKVTSFSDNVLTRVNQVLTQTVKFNINGSESPAHDLEITGIEIPDEFSLAIGEVKPIHQQSIKALPNLGYKNGPYSFQFKTQNRIADLQDLKQFLLLKFPKIQEVLIISHKDNQDANVPGLVRAILIPRSKSDSLSIANWPKFSTLELKQIQHFLNDHSVVGCQYSVENPIYEEIVLKGNIVIKAGVDKNEASLTINQAVLKGFLDFTGIQKKGFSFGKSIYTSKILSIIRNLPFIQSVTNFACYTRFDNELLLPENFNSLNYRVEPSNINHILIPSSQHFLEIKESNKTLSDGIGVSNMALETDFVIDKSRYLQKNLVIGSRKLGINLQINGDFDTENHAITELFL
jgi:hypothetical protein